MERETRIELATNSLEGCDSTIELLPRLFLFYTAPAAPLACAPQDRYDSQPRRSYDQNQHGPCSPWRYPCRSRSEYSRISRRWHPAGAPVERRYERAWKKRRDHRQSDRGF